MKPIFDEIPEQNKGCDISKIMTLNCLLFHFLLLLLFSAVKPRSVIICENHERIIICPNGKIIEVLNANYGRLNLETCFDTRIKSTNCSSSNSLKGVQDKCNGKISCELHVNNDLFGGDPCGGTYKYLEVKYRCLEYINLGKRENAKKCGLNYASHCSYSRKWFVQLGPPMLLRHTL